MYQQRKVVAKSLVLAQQPLYVKPPKVVESGTCVKQSPSETLLKQHCSITYYSDNSIKSTLLMPFWQY